ncbi:MAG: hypothetical protein K2O24_02155 [Muribaculaceae bacterium]|nr:hypothetical protein [Muribaculaceae bacterium]
MTTHNRIILLLAILLGATFGSHAQNVTTPYSMYGYGILGDRATSMQTQMGGVGYAMRSGRQINVMNPASYAAIDSLTFLFDMGADLSLLWSREGDARQHSTGGGLQYVTMQFPLSKHFGGSIGMVPYSSVGYAFGSDVTHGALENQGSGGINEAYLGVAAQYFGASLGVNVSYRFGNIINDFYATPSTQGQTLTEHVMQIRDWDIVIGAQYSFPVSRFDRMTLGLTYSPKKSMHGDTWVTIQELQATSVPDTVGSMGIGGHYYSPNTVGAGVSYTHERASRLTVEADLTWQQWSKAKYSAIPDSRDPRLEAFRGMEFADRLRYALGAEYVPRVRGSYFQRMAFRMGASYTDDYLRIQGNRMREFGISCGLGFHTIQDKTMINLGFEWKNRRCHPEAMLTENYFNITLGINFNEVWFWKRKIK